MPRGSNYQTYNRKPKDCKQRLNLDAFFDHFIPERKFVINGDFNMKNCKWSRPRAVIADGVRQRTGDQFWGMARSEGLELLNTPGAAVEANFNSNPEPEKWSMTIVLNEASRDGDFHCIRG